MGFADFYLQRFSTPGKKIDSPPPPDLQYIVVIPAYNEPGILHSIESLFRCHPISSPIEVILVINWPENQARETGRKNHTIFTQCLSWAKKNNSTSLLLISIALS